MILGVLASYRRGRVREQDPFLERLIRWSGAGWANRPYSSHRGRCTFIGKRSTGPKPTQLSRCRQLAVLILRGQALGQVGEFLMEHAKAEPDKNLTGRNFTRLRWLASVLPFGFLVGYSYVLRHPAHDLFHSTRGFILLMV